MTNIFKKIKEQQQNRNKINYKMINYELKTRNFGYEIFTKDKYIEYHLSKFDVMSINKNDREIIEEQWNKISKEYNFVIGVGYPEKMFYSVEYFNEKVLNK